MTEPSEPSSTWFRRPERPASRTELPMTTPLVPGVCPCGRPGDETDGFCDEHAGAVAFKVPLGAGGEILPATWWHWPHPEPCPYGEAWMIKPPASGAVALWACEHRDHEYPEQATG